MFETLLIPASATLVLVSAATYGGWGHRINASIALCMLRANLASAGTNIEVEILGKHYPATVQASPPLYGPTNARLRA